MPTTDTVKRLIGLKQVESKRVTVNITEEVVKSTFLVGTGFSKEDILYRIYNLHEKLLGNSSGIIKIECDKDTFSEYSDFLNSSLISTYSSYGIEVWVDDNRLQLLPSTIFNLFIVDSKNYNGKRLSDICDSIISGLHSINEVHMLFIGFNDGQILKIKNYLEVRIHNLVVLNDLSNYIHSLGLEDREVKNLNQYLSKYGKVVSKRVDLTTILKSVLSNVNSDGLISIGLEEYNKVLDYGLSIIGNRTEFYTVYFNAVELEEFLSTTYPDYDKQELYKYIIYLYGSIVVTLAYYRNIRFYVPSESIQYSNLLSDTITSLIQSLILSPKYKTGEAKLELAKYFFSEGIYSTYTDSLVKASLVNKDGNHVPETKIEVTARYIPMNELYVDFNSELFINECNLLDLDFTSTIVSSKKTRIIDYYLNNSIHIIPVYRENNIYNLNYDSQKLFENHMITLLDKLVNSLPSPRKLTIKDIAFVSIEGEVFVTIIEDISIDLKYNLWNPTLPYSQSLSINRMFKAKGKIDNNTDSIDNVCNLILRCNKPTTTINKLDVKLHNFIPLNFSVGYEDLLFRNFFTQEKAKIIEEYSSIDSNLIQPLLKGIQDDYRTKGMSGEQIDKAKESFISPPTNSLRNFLYYKELQSEYIKANPDNPKEDYPDYAMYRMFGENLNEVDSDINTVFNILGEDITSQLDIDIYGKPIGDIYRLDIKQLGGDINCYMRRKS